MVIVRETEKDLRLAQSKEFKELDPLVTTYHLPSMKIFFTNILTEQVHSKLIHSTLTMASFPFLWPKRKLCFNNLKSNVRRVQTVWWISQVLHLNAKVLFLCQMRPIYWLLKNKIFNNYNEIVIFEYIIVILHIWSRLFSHFLCNCSKIAFVRLLLSFFQRTLISSHSYLFRRTIQENLLVTLIRA